MLSNALGAYSQHQAAEEQSDFSAASQYAYILQYISLMIIILAMIVGFYGSSIMNKTEDIPVDKRPLSIPVTILGNFIPHEKLDSSPEYDNFFRNGQLPFDTKKADILAAFLGNHDLIAVLEINSGACADAVTPDCLMRETKYAKVLKQYLLDKALPADSIEVFYSEDVSKGGLRLRLYEGEVTS